MAKLPPVDGLLVLDKPAGMTSRDAVNRCIAWFPRRTRVGHTGTLDPLATGVLVLCVGKATRLAEFVQDMGKEYEAAITLGGRSTTDDADGTVTSLPCPEVDESKIRDVLTRFVGSIEQTPPAYSAVHVDGRRAHAIARQGDSPAIPSRMVNIERIDLLSYVWPILSLRVSCGKGTYIRSLARDLGEVLGTGGYISALRRTRVGPFHADEGVPLDAERPEVMQSLRPTRDAIAQFPAVTLNDEQTSRVSHGQAVLIVGEARGPVAMMTDSGILIGIGNVSAEGMLQPGKILNAMQ